MCSEQKEPNIFPGKADTILYQLKNLDESNINHTEEVIIEQNKAQLSY